MCQLKKEKKGRYNKINTWEDSQVALTVRRLSSDIFIHSSCYDVIFASPTLAETQLHKEYFW